MKIAIVGTGIAGLSAARFLHARHEVVVYEKEPRLGGHSRTVSVRHGDREIAVDTGFIVFNERNYPNLTRLFAHLGVRTKDSDMSFALTVGNGSLEWGAKSANAIFGQRRNLIRPSFLKLFGEVMRFNEHAARYADDASGISLGALLDRMNLSEAFRVRYLLPMAGAIWSCPPSQMLDFPAKSFIRFFVNHGLLSVRGQPQWLTVDGGAGRYVEKLAAPFADRVRAGSGVAAISRTRKGIRVRDVSGHEDMFDHVVLASHADESLHLLTDVTEEERATLGAIPYQKNRAVLHKDPQFMPKRRRCWASWVYHSDGTGREGAICVTYWMNRLQAIDERYPLFVTLNPTREIPAEMVFDEHVFQHPVFDRSALRAQEHLKAMQGTRNTWFCGAWLGHGFHEDGLVSAILVGEALDGFIPWRRGTATRAPRTSAPPVRVRAPMLAREPLAGAAGG
jgi:predicted NAD/FAD-binding protein